MYDGLMKLGRSMLLWVGLVGLAIGATGCGGINASHSISPASLLLPGLIESAAPMPSSISAVVPVLGGETHAGAG